MNESLRRYGSSSFRAPTSSAYHGQLLLLSLQRAVELLGDVDERSRGGDLDGERPHLVAIAAERELARACERLVDRCRAGRGIAVHVAADPGAERERARRVRQALAPGLEQIGRGRDQAVLEEPECVPDLVRHAQPVVAHLVGLPEQRHLLGNPLLGFAPLGRRDPRVVQHDELGLDADVREEHAAPRRLGRMRGQDELDRGAGCTRRPAQSPGPRASRLNASSSDSREIRPSCASSRRRRRRWCCSARFASWK